MGINCGLGSSPSPIATTKRDGVHCLFDRDYCAIYCTGRRQPPRYACARAYWQYGSVSCSDKRATSQSQSQSIACICKSGRSATEAFNTELTVCLCAAPRRDASSVTKRRRCLGLWVHAAGVPDLLLGRFAHVGHWLLHKSSACPVLAPGSFICFFQAQSAVAA